MNYNSLFKGIVSFLLLVSFANAHNDCKKILQLGTKNINDCVENKNGRVVSLKIQNTDLTQDELNKIFSFESITSLELGFSPSGLILPSNLRKISFDGVNLSQSDISELSVLPKLQELGFQNTENISTEIINSLNLKRLNIDGIKEISQELKDTLKTLVNLEELTINVDNFSNGGDILMNLKNLKKLSLKTNSIPQNLINEIKTLTNLENLQLDFEGEQSNTIDNNVFANFKKMNTLSLSYIKLSQDNVNEIAKLSNLKQIELYNIDLNGLNLDAWKSLTKLENLVLLGNSISAIPEEINNFVNLQTLNITNNKIAAVTTPLTGLKNLKTLDLSSNLLTTLPNEFGELSSLQSLYVHDNVIADLPTGFGNLNIEYLDLNDNLLKVLPTSILSLKNLKYLDLAFNQLTSLPDNIVNVKNLQYLDLSDNEFIVLPSQLFNMVSLEVINFNYNSLQNTVIPSTIGKMTNLKELYLQNAYIESIPSEIVNCKNLEVLDLSSNEISSLPSKFGNLQNLKKLYLSDNYISSISSELGKLNNLNELDLSFNEINGDIPSTLHQLHYLEVISLANNEDIEGEVLTNRGLNTCEYTVGSLLCKSKEMICLGNIDLPNCTTAGTVVTIDIGPDSDYSDVIDDEPSTTIIEDIPTTTTEIEIPTITTTTTTEIEIPTTTTTTEVEVPTTTTTTTTITPTSTSCWSEALGYPCCSPDNTTVYSHDNDGDWGFDFKLGEWCGIVSNNEIEEPVETCWSEKLGYPCCTGCKVYYVDSDGSWGYEKKDWCGIKPTCSN